MSRDEIRSVDEIAATDYHMPSIVLMENAGSNAAELLISTGVTRKVTVCCGCGNNGGDGFVIARHLENRGVDVRVLVWGDRDKMSDDASTNLKILEAARTPVDFCGKTFEAGKINPIFEGSEWIIDALLGTGTQGEIRAPFDDVIDAINAARKRVLAVDIPSGLDCDTGHSLGHCIEAELTASFVAAKIGFQQTPADRFTGAVHVLDIGVPRVLVDHVAHATKHFA